MSHRPAPPASSAASPSESFAENALRLAGKSDDEARRTGAIDRADDQAERLFRSQNQTAASPIHRAVWERELPAELFESAPLDTPPAVQRVMDESLAIVRRHREAGTIWDERQQTSQQVIDELGVAGYWGLLVDVEHGGSGASLRSFSAFLTRMAALEPAVAGLASVHGCIGAVDPLRTFGTESQKRRWLPRLATGERLSAFALTEPGAGSDLTALRTTAVRDGDEFVVNGEKLFITNVAPGRTIALVCLVDRKPAILICDLPQEETPQFQLTRYGLHALRHTPNRGIVLRDFRVPADNLLETRHGNGLTIAYHGLNLGRVALCAAAAGNLRRMLASLVPWVRYRSTYGAPIGQRELVRRRIGRLAALTVACDALTAWCSTLLDRGWRGEMECIVAKIFGAEAEKEAAVELLMKTHGGRAFLHGHLLGDNLHEFLAPCIYEGEGEMLGMAFFKSLVKQHGATYFEPIAKALQKAGIRRPNFWNPHHLAALGGAGAAYARWLAKETFAPRPRAAWPLAAWPQAAWPLAAATPSDSSSTEPATNGLRRHFDVAAAGLQRSAREISGVMRKHQLKLADRQCRISEISLRVQQRTTILATTLYAARHDDPIVRQAADVVCRDLGRQLSGARPSDDDFRATTELGRLVTEGGFRSFVENPTDDILWPYLS